MKSKKIISLIMTAIFMFTAFGTLTACQKEEEPVVKERYDFIFDVNYEGGTNRADTVKAGYKANYYSARRTGYTLVNWYTSKDCKEVFDFSTPINKDYTVYALWKKRGDDVDITFHYNYKNSFAPVTVTGETGKVIDLSIVPDPKRLGYAVEGWYTDENCTHKWNMQSDVVTAELDLYAKYDYTANLKFDDDGNVVLKDVEVNIAFEMPSWTGRRSLNEIVDNFNDEYSGKIYLNWTTSYTNEVARFEDAGRTNQYIQNNYRIGEILDLVNLSLDKNEYYETAIRENYVGDALMTFPVGHMMSSIMYNKAMLKELGEEEPKTHADFVRVLEKANETFSGREGYRATLVYENEWQYFEIGSHNIWANNGLTHYSYDSATGKYVNNFALAENQDKLENAVKGYAEILNNPDIKTDNSALWTNTAPFMDVVNGNAFMAIVGLPKMYTNHIEKNATGVHKKIGIMPITNLFNYADTKDAMTFVKGISLCLPNDTDAVFDIEQLAAIAVFCKYLEKNSGLLGYNGTYPASKTGQNSEAMLSGSATHFTNLRDGADPSTFVTLPGSQVEYYCYNNLNQSCVNALAMVKSTSLTDESLIKSVMGLVQDSVSQVVG